MRLPRARLVRKEQLTEHGHGTPAPDRPPLHPRHAVGRFARNAAEVGRARELVRSSLTSWDLSQQVDALELAVSELVTNAMVHGAGGIEVHLTAEDDTLRLAVVDSGGDPPARVETSPSPGSAGGWGLRLVEQLADAWGAVSGPTHTRVWMERSTAPDRADDERP